MIRLPLSQPPLGLPWSINRASPQATGLVAWYTPLSAMGVLPVDRAGGSYLTLAGASSASMAIRPTHTIGRYVHKDTLGGYTINGGPGLLSACTWSIWINVTAHVTGAWHYIMDGRNNGGTWVAHAAGTTQYRSNNVLIIDESEITLGRWHQLTLVAPGSSGGSVYLDGLPLRTLASGDHRQPVSAMKIGLAFDNTVPGRFDIGEWRFYRRALSAAEVFATWAPQTRWDLYAPILSRAKGGGSVPYYHVLRQTIGAAA